MMYKQIFAISLAALFLVSCNNDTNQQQKEEPILETEEEYIPFDGTNDKEHNAQNSLDYEGKYLGTLPCADCEGIETRLELKPAGEYEMSMTYLGKGLDNVLKDAGKFSWDETGSVITLNSTDGSKDYPVKFHVGENRITQLDQEGKEISGPLAENYILDKEM